MTSSADLLKALSSGASSAWAYAPSTSRRASCLYELYIFKLILEAAESAGAKTGKKALITFRTADGNSVSPTRLITGPHNITDPKYIYAEIRFRRSRKRALEVHMGVKFRGKSGVEHECDVAVLGSTEADRSRHITPSLPRFHKILFAVECKLYTTNINLGMSRAFIGLTTDLTVPNDNNFYVASSSIAKNGQNLIKFHDKKWHEQLKPSKSTNVNILCSSFKNIFVSFLR